MNFEASVNRFSSFDDNSYPKDASIVAMKDELIYHYNNYLKNKSEHQQQYMKYEIFAYLSVVGRIYYFLRTNNLLKLTPKIEKFISIRHKFIAHRSVDEKKTVRAGWGEVVEIDKGENANAIDYCYSFGVLTDGHGHVVLSEMGFGLDKNGDFITMPEFSIHAEHGEIIKEVDNALYIFNK